MAARSDNALLKKATHAAAVTTSDTVDLANEAYQGLYIGTTGSVKIITSDGDTVTFTSVPVGFFPVQVRRVFATGTTASNIVALY